MSVLPRGNASLRRICKIMLVFQWFPKDSQAVAMVWTGEEDPYVFLAINENVDIPMVSLGFQLIPNVMFFLPAGNQGFPLVLQGFPALMFLT